MTLNTHAQRGRIRTLFGREVDIDNVSQTSIEKLRELFGEDVIVHGMSWVRTADYIEEDNIGIRAGGTPDAMDTLGADFENNGYDETKPPPIREIVLDELLDGRTRFTTANELNEPFFPVLDIEIPNVDNSIKRRVGLELNKHKYLERASSEDFIVAITSDITEGFVKNDTDAIRYWLFQKYNIGNYYSEAGGTITKIVKAAMARAVDDSGLVRNKPRSGWEAWLEKKVNLTISKTSPVVLLQVGGNRAEQFFLRHLLPAAAKGRKAQLVLYTGAAYENSAREKIKSFMKEVNDHYKLMFKAVSGTIPNLTVQPPEPAFELLGIIPQIQNDFQKTKYEYGELVSYDDYMNIK